MFSIRCYHSSWSGEPGRTRLERNNQITGDKQQLAVVLPVFNDWVSCARLISELDAMADEFPDLAITLIIVDDGSTEEPDADAFARLQLKRISLVRLVELECNLGHQRAIAIGLNESTNGSYGMVAIMDSDGEDRPADLARLLRAYRDARAPIIVAARTKRSEGPLFKIFYNLYRVLFKVLTGERIQFGNFSVLSPSAARRLVHMPELWNNFPAAVLKSRLKYRAIPTERGTRFRGKSRMGVANLITHGLSAISVNSERVFARVLIFCAVLGLITVAVAATLVWLKLTMNVTIPGPGWTSTAIGILAVIFSQIAIFFLLSIFLLLQARSAPVYPTAEIAPSYIRRIREIAVGQARVV